MRKNLMFFALAAIGLASCNGGYKKGDGGMLYNLFADKPGTKIKEGDFIMMNLVITNDADSVLFSSYDHERPEPMLVPAHQYKGDIFDGLKMLTEGDSASIKLPADSIYKKSPKPPTFKGKYLIYTVKIEKFIPKGKLTDQEFQAKVEGYMQDANLALKNQEPARIKKYIDDKKLNVTKTDSGLYYVITQKGSGPTVAAGDTAVVNYTGSLLNGKAFDSNIKEVSIKEKLPISPERQYVPIHIPIGEKKVIAGWDQGMLLLNKGAKATFIVPSSLAYSDKSNGPIGPFTSLVFDVELVNIIHPNPNAPKPAAAPSITQPAAKK